MAPFNVSILLFLTWYN